MSVGAERGLLLRELTFDGSWSGWRNVARDALAASLAPRNCTWLAGAHAQPSLLVERASDISGPCTPISSRALASHAVPKSFLTLGADVACHASPARWDQLYRVLWRLTHGERHLLDVFVDADVHPLHVMAKAVRREGHKLRAFVRFRLVAAGTDAERYVAWFEPAHDVLAREAPFFARRFPSMRWSILTPNRSAHWDGVALTYAAGASRADAPSGDDLEELWRTYYAHIFNPARTSPRTMRSEMPIRYWKHLPEAALIAPLLREAPARVREMIARQQAASNGADRGPLAKGRVPARQFARAMTRATTRPATSGPVHDEGVEAALHRGARARAILAARGVAPTASPLSGADIRIGTASWTDPTMTARGVFYPDDARDARSRLEFYASRHSMVEVDATYYSLPSRHVAARWAERTPDGFCFDIKAHALMTGHATSTARLPHDLRAALPARLAGRAEVRTSDLPADMVDEVWHRFIDALEPLREAGKLGALLLQMPRTFTPSDEAERTIGALRARAGDLACAVEFRHASWVTEGERRTRTLALLRAHDLAYVMVDAPPGFATSMPPIVAVTSERLAMVRLHGRRRETWERSVEVVSERYRYLYDAAELGSWVPTIIDVAQRTQGVHVVMNNCHANYGTSNADEISALLVEADLERRRMWREGRLLMGGR